MVKRSHYTPWTALGGRGGVLPTVFLFNLDTRRKWVVSITPRPRFTPGERAPGTHCTGGWVGPRAGLAAEDREKILYLCRRSNPGRPVRSQTLYWLNYSAHSDLSAFMLRILPIILPFYYQKIIQFAQTVPELKKRTVNLQNIWKEYQPLDVIKNSKGFSRWLVVLQCIAFASNPIGVMIFNSVPRQRKIYHALCSSETFVICLNSI
jgi:hypothetical protein